MGSRGWNRTQVAVKGEGKLALNWLAIDPAAGHGNAVLLVTSLHRTLANNMNPNYTVYHSAVSLSVMVVVGWA